MSRAYLIYGLRLKSNRLLPVDSCAPFVSEQGVQVFFEAFPDGLGKSKWEGRERYTSPFLQDDGSPSLRVSEVAEGRYFRLLYADGTEFLIDRQGTEIWANWPEPLTLEDTATYLLGPVLGFVLRLRGTTCLHASSIAVGDRAIAVLGPAGAGKSTTAASFAQAGYSILSEDVVALVDCQDHFLVQPGYPLIRLWPESVAALFGNDDALPRLTPTWDKRRFDLVGEAPRFQSEPLPLAAIYYLDERRPDPQAPYIEPFLDSQKLMTLIANTYVNYLLDERMRASEFGVLGRLCKNVPVRRIVPHSEFSSLARLREVILDDLHGNVPRKEKGVSA